MSATAGRCLPDQGLCDRQVHKHTSSLTGQKEWWVTQIGCQKKTPPDTHTLRKCVVDRIIRCYCTQTKDVTVFPDTSEVIIFLISPLYADNILITTVFNNDT